MYLRIIADINAMNKKNSPKENTPKRALVCTFLSGFFASPFNSYNENAILSRKTIDDIRRSDPATRMYSAVYVRA